MTGDDQLLVLKGCYQIVDVYLKVLVDGIWAAIIKRVLSDKRQSVIVLKRMLSDRR